MNNPLTPYFFYLAGCVMFSACALRSMARNEKDADLYFLVSAFFLIGTIIGMFQVK